MAAPGRRCRGLLPLRDPTPLEHQATAPPVAGFTSVETPTCGSDASVPNDALPNQNLLAPKPQPSAPCLIQCPRIHYYTA